MMPRVFRMIMGTPVICTAALSVTDSRLRGPPGGTLLVRPRYPSPLTILNQKMEEETDARRR